MKQTITAFVAILIFVLAFLGLRSGEPPALDIPLLASDVNFTVGGHPIVIPVVAMAQPGPTFSLSGGRSGKPAERILGANNPDEPKTLDKLSISISEYQETGARTEAFKICPLLKRKWSETICRGRHKGLLRRLPQTFNLLDRRKLEILKTTWTVGGEVQYDQIKDMSLRLGETKMSCDKNSKFCTAMVEVWPRLVAVWTVWSDDRTGVTATQMADSQGEAIVQFVRRAIGPIEDETLVTQD